MVAEPWQLDPAAPPPDVIVLGLPRVWRRISTAPSPDSPHTDGSWSCRTSTGHLVADALRAGAYGCVARGADDEELLLAMGAVARGGLHISRDSSPSCTPNWDNPSSLPPRPLSPAARPRHSAGSPPG
ncbi:hypothetical protein NKH18_15195 [Streptomyces sp. M10(2022)]